MRVLVTGGAGFVGRHLVEHLVKCGDVVAASYKPGAFEKEELEKAFPRSVQFFALDVTDRKELDQLISLARPDVIYHLAAITFVPEAEENASLAYDVNALGTLNLLESVKENSPESKVLNVSTSEVYGIPAPGSLPITELGEVKPHSMYGASKACGDILSCKYAERDGLHVVRVRPFPHFGPGQSSRFALSSFAKQLAEVKLGIKSPAMTVGNLEVKRDYSDVSDIVRGYREAALNGKAGEAYNLCSGESHSIGELLNKLIEISGVEIEVQVDESLVRKVDIPDIKGSFDKAQKSFGWKPRVSIDESLRALFAYWYEELSPE